jgi:hypothetical protein
MNKWEYSSLNFGPADMQYFSQFSYVYGDLIFLYYKPKCGIYNFFCLYY